MKRRRYTEDWPIAMVFLSVGALLIGALAVAALRAVFQ